MQSKRFIEQKKTAREHNVNQTLRQQKRLFFLAEQEQSARLSEHPGFQKLQTSSCRILCHAVPCSSSLGVGCIRVPAVAQACRSTRLLLHYAHGRLRRHPTGFCQPAFLDYSRAAKRPCWLDLALVRLYTPNLSHLKH